MTENDQKQLGKTLWAVADQLRGTMDADDFRDYMLSFLFLRYLSDNYEAAAKKELGSDYPDPHAIGNAGRTPLSVWYAENPADVVAFEQQMRRKAHYVIKPKYVWGHIVHLAKTEDDTLLDTLQGGFKYIEEESLPEPLPGSVLGDQPRLGQARPQLPRPQRQAVRHHQRDRARHGVVLHWQRHAG